MDEQSKPSTPEQRDEPESTAPQRPWNQNRSIESMEELVSRQILCAADNDDSEAVRDRVEEETKITKSDVVRSNMLVDFETRLKPSPE